MLQGLTVKKLEKGDLYCGSFQAMASGCEILIECSEALSAQKRAQELAQEICEAVFIEAKRIEAKFSRYLKTNIVYQINNSAGKTVCVDDESAHLIDFAYLCYQLSDGLFDISSGILGKIWVFNQSDKLPDKRQIKKLLPFIGLNKLTWKSPYLTLPAGMQLDFGGIGKEYAVDCCLAKALEVNSKVPMLLNFGGDLICTGKRKNGEAWQVGIESVGGGKPGGKPAVIKLNNGALATSGDANKYLLKKGIRYSHILNPLTGKPVTNAPRSITVSAQTCIEAGLLSTMAMLQGDLAEAFLNEQQINFWVQK